MKEIVILQNCSQCNTPHLGLLELKKVLYAGAAARARKPKQISTMVSCPETKETFKITFSLIPDEGTEVLGAKSLVFVPDQAGVTDKVVQHLLTTAKTDQQDSASSKLPKGKIIIPPNKTVIAGYQIVALIT